MLEVANLKFRGFKFDKLGGERGMTDVERELEGRRAGRRIVMVIGDSYGAISRCACACACASECGSACLCLDVTGNQTASQ